MDVVSFNVTKFYNDQSRLQYWGLEHFGIRTDEFDTVMKKLKIAGARVLEESKNAGDGHRIAFIETPEAVKIEVSEILKK